MCTDAGDAGGWRHGHATRAARTAGGLLVYTRTPPLSCPGFERRCVRCSGDVGQGLAAVRPRSVLPATQAGCAVKFPAERSSRRSRAGLDAKRAGIILTLD